MTNGELVSIIWNDLRTKNKDEHLSRRHVLNVAKKYAKKFISQKLKDGTLFREDSLLTDLRCFELEKDDIVRCDIVEFKRCISLMKSKKKIPELINSIYGESIHSVTSINGQFFTRTSLEDFEALKYTKFPDLKRYLYYVRDGYLYLPNSEVEVVDLLILTQSPEDADEASGCSDCDECESIWDKDFICPDKHEDDAITLTLQELSSTWRSITPDENPDKDANIRSQKTV